MKVSKQDMSMGYSQNEIEESANTLHILQKFEKYGKSYYTTQPSNTMIKNLNLAITGE